jgi:hypothetical protein
MVKCPYCRKDFGNTPYAETLDVEGLSKNTMMIYCPNSDCNMFLGIGNGREEERRRVPSGF